MLHDKPIRGREIVKTGYTFDNKMRLMVGSMIFTSLCFYVRWVRPLCVPKCVLTPDRVSGHGIGALYVNRTVSIARHLPIVQELGDGWTGIIIRTERYFGELNSSLLHRRWLNGKQSSWMPS